MKADKTSIIRDYILDLLEQEKLHDGQKIPGARDIASITGVSFLKVQQGLETLVRDGILETRGRTGTFIQNGWNLRILHDNISIFRQQDSLPWLSGFQKMIESSIPGLRFTHAFKQSMLELKNTLYVQKNHEEFMDLSGIMKECFPARDQFFENAFSSFYTGDKLVGIPMAFSPRVIYFNPKWFEKAGCDMPSNGWTWDDFISSIRQLKRVLPSDRVLNLLVQPHYWLNLVMRGGGHIFKNGEIAIGTPETKRSLKLFADLWKELDLFQLNKTYREAFIAGDAAMYIEGRQFTSNLIARNVDWWDTVQLPLIPGGRDVSSQATDLICVRKSCTNLSLVKEFVKFMLSEKVQDFLGKHKYAIPIRKSSAFKSIDLTDPRDSLFAVEMGKIETEPVAEHANIANLLLAGLDKILVDKMDIDSSIDQLVQVSKVFQSIQIHSKQRNPEVELVSII